MNAKLEEKLKQLPKTPGVYFHKNAAGEIIYVGKAAVLRNRVRQYFQSSRLRDAKTDALVAEIDMTDWMETESEIDALFLESEMVKRYMPRYNILLRDDKSQMYVRITMQDEWPYVGFTRHPLDDGASYFGPYYNGFAVKKALRYLRRVYPYFIHERRAYESELYAQIGLNPDKNTSSKDYKANLRKLIEYIEGGRKKLTKELERDMQRAAKEQRFEDAVRLRNRLRNLQDLQHRIMFGDKEFLDISKDRALSDLQHLLGLEKPLRRIEGYDIAHMSGADVVASMVVFTNGVSDRAQYRKFKMADQRNDDTANMHATLVRRLSEKNMQTWGVPNLVLIDGGKGQLNAALRALEAVGAEVPCISVAKRDEQIYVHKSRSHVQLHTLEKLMHEPDDGVAVYEDGDYVVVNLHFGTANAGSHSRNLRGSEIVSHYDDVTKLFQRIRDEAHRFAISYHTTLKRSRATESILDDIPGVGPTTRKKLMKVFGSGVGVKRASLDELQKVMGPKTGKTTYEWLHGKEKL